MTNQSVINIGKVLALFGAILDIVIIVLGLFSISLEIGIGSASLSGTFGKIFAIALNGVTVAILADKIKVNDRIVRYIIVLVLGFVAGNLLVILGGILLIIGHFIT